MVGLLDFTLSKPNLSSKTTITQNKCIVDDLCRYCNPYYKINCCLFKKILNTQVKSKKVIFEKCYSNKCINSSDCCSIIDERIFGKEKKIFIQDIPEKSEIFTVGYKLSKPFQGFKQNFIPRIDISPQGTMETQIEIIKNANQHYLAVSLQDLMSEDENLIIKSNYLKHSLHKTLKYDGKILLLTNISDIFCEKLLKKENILRFIEELKILKPNVMTTLDANFYLSQPLFITLFQLFRVIQANKLLNDSKIDLVGLIPPIPLIFKDLLTYMLKLGHKTVCVPLLEVNKYKNFKLRDKTVGYLNDFKRKFSFEFLLISTNPYVKTYVDYFSSQTWIKKNVASLEFNEKAKIWEKNLNESIKKAKLAAKQNTIYNYFNGEEQ